MQRRNIMASLDNWKTTILAVCRSHGHQNVNIVQAYDFDNGHGFVAISADWAQPSALTPGPIRLYRCKDTGQGTISYTETGTGQPVNIADLPYLAQQLAQYTHQIKPLTNRWDQLAAKTA
jgi:hypothetical protein